VNYADDDTVAVQKACQELGRISVAEHSLESVLRRVTALSAEVLPGEPVVSVTIVDGPRPATAAASGPVALTLDELQYALGSGPCLTAATTGHRTEIVDTGRPARWPEFAAGAATQGCGSVLSFPLPGQERLSGALNLYAAGFTVSEPRLHDAVVRLADSAVVPVSNAYLYTAAVQRAANLQTALDSRAVIDQAKGILMERFRLTADQAFQALTRVSMETNTKVRDVAERFVDTGELRLD
jgi:hypothetical protein